MEKIFNFKRFWLLVRKHFNESRKTFLISFVLLFAPGILMALLMINPKQDDSNFLFYIVSLIFIGGLYTTMFFKEWTFKSRAASILLSPATPFEKLALVLFFSVIIFFPVFTLVYQTTVFIITGIFNKQGAFLMEYHGLTPITSLFIYALVPYLFFNSLFLLFSICFKKKQATITFGVIMFLYIAIGIGNMHYINSFTAFKSLNVNINQQFMVFPTIVEYSNYYRENASTKISSLFILNTSIIVVTISTLLFYLASYFKLREKQV